VKSVDEIYQELLDAFAQRAGFVPENTCDLAVRLYAAAAQIQALNIQAEWVLDQSFPQTARGMYLDRHAAMRGLSRLPASKAAGTLRFSVDSPPALSVGIPAGTVCMTADERRFQTTGGVTLEVGKTYVDAPAEALEAGSGGNAVAGAVRFLTACPVAVTACVNPAAFSGGSDAEDFSDYIRYYTDKIIAGKTQAQIYRTISRLAEIPANKLPLTATIEMLAELM